MSTIGVAGMGKLGAPVALAIESKGHEVVGFDVRDEPYGYIQHRYLPYTEEGVEPLLERTNIEMVRDLGRLVGKSDIIFLPVQTPHLPQYEGDKPLPRTRVDFDYHFLEGAVAAVAAEAIEQEKPTTLAVISTCLPGTFRERIRPLLNQYVDYVYTPQFISMGNVVQDYLDPEFALIGVDSQAAADQLEEFYDTLFDKPHVVTDITTAEGIKVFYNTFITAKTLLANSWMQTAHKLGMNVDDITKAMSVSNKRLLSPNYLRGGGPDSGGCHPRDLIALSWLGKKIDLEPNWFEMMAEAREEQTRWTANLVKENAERWDLPVVIMGKSFKPETNIETGSGAVLLKNILAELGLKCQIYDPNIDNSEDAPTIPAVYFIATNHKEFLGWKYPTGSVILDLWRSIEPPEGCLYIPIGNPNAIQDKRRKGGV